MALTFYAGDRILIGITKGNVERMLLGEPFGIDLARPVRSVSVFYGINKVDILRQMELAGHPVPRAVHAAAEADPS